MQRRQDFLRLPETAPPGCRWTAFCWIAWTRGRFAVDARWVDRCCLCLVDIRLFVTRNQNVCMFRCVLLRIRVPVLRASVVGTRRRRRPRAGLLSERASVDRPTLCSVRDPESYQHIGWRLDGRRAAVLRLAAAKEGWRAPALPAHGEADGPARRRGLGRRWQATAEAGFALCPCSSCPQRHACKGCSNLAILRRQLAASAQVFLCEL